MDAAVATWAAVVFFGSRFAYLPRGPRDSRVGFFWLFWLFIASVGGGCETVSAGTAVGSLCLLVGAAPLFVVVVALLPGPVDCRAPLIMGEVAEEE